MPRLALFLALVWFVSLFVFRTALQWWRTGSTGVKGFSGPVGSLEWNAGLLISLGLVCATAAPIAALFDWPGGALLVANRAVHLGGACTAALGIAGALFSQLSMGDSWRVGVDASEQTELVTRGLFGFVRNPIFSFIMVYLLGLALLIPTVLSLLAVALSVAGIEIQVRAVEEPYLARVHGAAYAAYCSQTGRFLPGVGVNFNR